MSNDIKVKFDNGEIVKTNDGYKFLGIYRFQVDDNFEDAVDLVDRIPGKQELPGGRPFPIQTKLQTYGIQTSGKTIEELKKNISINLRNQREGRR